ncbi:thioredoxin trx1 [Sparganum proliferum]
MTVAKITSAEEFKEKIATGALLVDFYATWCGPCKALAPKLDKLAEDTKDVVFLKVDVDECEELAQSYEITAMPTIIGFKNGTVLDKVVGANEEKIKELLKKLTE